MSIKWSGDLQGNIQQVDDRVRRGMVAAAQYTAPQIESFMKGNAPWTDQTGAARNGLRATVKTSGSSVAIIVYHSVPYGIFLEVRWGGRYAILRPAIAMGAPLLAETIKRLVFS